MNEELIAKAREAKSVEELLALAKENNYPLTEEEAQNIFNQFHATGELSDDELDQVGGGCGSGEESIPKGYWTWSDAGFQYCSSYHMNDGTLEYFISHIYSRCPKDCLSCMYLEGHPTDSRLCHCTLGKRPKKK